MHWLDLPDLATPVYRVVRCPQHWTEWAMRHTALRRTNDGKLRMKLAHRYARERQYLFDLDPYVEPFPYEDLAEGEK